MTTEQTHPLPGDRQWQLETGRAIHRSALEVFTTMLGMDMSAGQTIISRSEPEYHSSVIALLGLTGEWSGSGQLSCDKTLACRIASTMLMAEYDSVDNDVTDAVAEIANMVIGNVKNALEVTLGPMRLSTPTILFGGDFGTRVAGSPERIIVPFKTTDGAMTVQILLTPKSTASSARQRAHRN